jgi:hypothetical protein
MSTIEYDLPQEALFLLSAFGTLGRHEVIPDEDVAHELVRLSYHATRRMRESGELDNPASVAAAEEDLNQLLTELGAAARARGDEVVEISAFRSMLKAWCPHPPWC